MKLLAKVGFAWVAGLALAQADERILSFDSTIVVAHDGTLEVREAIRVNAEGDDIRRGIYRDFPTTYPAGDGRQIVVGFAFESATRDGVEEPWRIEQRGNGVRIYLGNPNATLPHGEHRYEIVYRTDRQMGFFADHDELYWNVTGNGWSFPIDRATARVILPANIPRADVRMEGYTGAQGAKAQDFSSRYDGDDLVWRTTRELRPQQGLTIVAMWPKGYIDVALERPFVPSPIQSQDYDSIASQPRYASPAEAMLDRPLAHDGKPAYIAGFGLLALLLYYYFMWDRLGRDPPSRVTIPLYESPKGQSPAAMRYLMQMDFDDKCFAAAVLSLAVKGHLRIEQSDGALGFRKTYTLHKLTPPTGSPPRSEDEMALMWHVFKSADAIELKQENHRDIRSARLAQYSSLAAQYKSKFFHINGGWHLLGILFSIVLIAIVLALPGATDLWPEWHLTTRGGWFTIGCVVLALVSNGLFGKLLKAPTIAGQSVMDQIRGFKMYLEVAESEELKRINAPPLTPALFESFLPAALALGVEQAWAERFADVFRMNPDSQPSWYTGSGWNAAHLAGFTAGLGSSLDSAISSSSTAPGSSSGGGGGGSSGGGGGGGGGGGW